MYRKTRKVSLVLGAVRPAYDPDYATVLQLRAQLSDATMSFLKGYKYANDLIRKLATMK